MIMKKKGQALVEYAIILGLVSICVITALTQLGDNVKNTFNIFNKTFDSMTLEENVPQYVDVYMAKIGNNFLGFYVDPEFEKKYQSNDEK